MVIGPLGPLHTPEAVAREDTVTPMLRHGCGNSERCADLPHITQHKVAEPSTESRSHHHPIRGSHHVTLQFFSADPF